MIQDKVKTQLEQIKKQRQQMQDQLSKVLASSKVEGERILKELGVDTELDKVSLSELVTELREANPRVRDFLRKLDVATYDNRFRFNWNTTMLSAMAKQQAEKTYVSDLKPRLETLRSNVSSQLNTVSSQLKELQHRTQDLRSKISA